MLSTILIQVGDSVRLKKGGPYPLCAARAVQNVIELRTGEFGPEVRIQRIHKNRLVACWVGTQWIEKVLLPEEALIPNACPLKPRSKGSADELFARGWCQLCRENQTCQEFQKRLRGSS